MRRCALLWLVLCTLGALLPGCNSSLPDAQAGTPADWPVYNLSTARLSFAYPPGWNVFPSLKSAQITPNSQPAWSSYAGPDDRRGGPTLDLLYDLNRGMGATPQEELQNLQSGFAELEVVETAVPLPANPAALMAVLRHPADGSLLLLGAVEVAPGRVVALTGSGPEEALREAFAVVLGSVGTGGAGSASR